MSGVPEKGGGGLHDIKMLLRENPLPLLAEVAVATLAGQQKHRRYSLIALAGGVAVAVVIVLSKA